MAAAKTYSAQSDESARNPLITLMKLIAHPPKLDLPIFMGRLKEF